MAKKAQSAMEYLMTYGWAILIISIVLASLFNLGVFGGSTFIGTACIAGSGFYCQSPVLYTNGNLSFTFGQNIGQTLYDTGLACVSSTSVSGLPNPANALVELSGSPTVGSATPQTASPAASPGSYTPLTVSTGQIVSVSGLKCFGTTGAPLNGISIGTQLSGSVYMNYTLSNSIVTGNWVTVKIATITVQAK